LKHFAAETAEMHCMLPITGHIHYAAATHNVQIYTTSTIHLAWHITLCQQLFIILAKVVAKLTLYQKKWLTL